MSLNPEINHNLIMPQFSKILEKLFERRLDSFLKKYNLINESQYVFQSGWSNAIAIDHLVVSC